MPRYTVASSAYLKKHGTLTHPMHLAQHRCFGYAYLSTPGVWRYANANGEQATVRPTGQLRVNNGEALLPAVIAGLGIADLPDFIIGEAIAAKKVEVILKDWKQIEGAVHLVMPPGGPRPARVEVLIDYLAHHLARSKRPPEAHPPTCHNRPKRPALTSTINEQGLSTRERRALVRRVERSAFATSPPEPAPSHLIA